ncbi:hypothetical protein LEP1GSC038_2998 [Leptospira weilii str. 2006001855]|uniref:Uncharacterized protein n=2 Tax=Leptospira weilii TaxID=28184 RepID=M6PZ44_9LEPT|nr:hypothetical protein [Leptospira weilii]EMM71258.1 hypothetical protein LEP1GSC038_2998 [Leptospira weilii str. 2006001855]EMN88561.1 hypothetical protein LEP1GSC108_2129 [Leptospira weilii str. UI 13098]OMI19233.1 hypothetical protein BUQ74_00200 [Leptospira weilii serovar Heyan]QDK22824.1 hypothetical protein FHG67_08950 [Leptospira weilii]QDK27531.1 hypothetical protein FHG68_13280 [Leptospira weilii]
MNFLLYQKDQAARFCPKIGTEPYTEFLFGEGLILCGTGIFNIIFLFYRQTHVRPEFTDIGKRSNFYLVRIPFEKIEAND